MKMLRKALLLLICLLIMGCNGEKKIAEKDNLRVYVGTDTESMDPGKMSSTHGAMYAHTIFEGLTKMGADGLPKLAAADKCDVSKDGLTYTFHLRENSWHNGDTVRAGDFVYAYRRILDPKFASVYAYMLYMIKGAQEYNQGKAGADALAVKALDEKTLQITLRTPTPYFLSACNHQSLYPVNPKVVEANGDWATKAETLVGNGAYKISKWVRNNKMVVVKNEKYWDAKNVPGKMITFHLLDKANTGHDMFDNKELDFEIGAGRDRRERLKKEGKLYEANSIHVSYYTANNLLPPFDNPKVRKAISYALHRQKTIDVITNFAPYKAAFGLVPYGIKDPETGKDFRQVGGELFTENLAEAKKLLAQAGYPEGKNFPPIQVLVSTAATNIQNVEMLQETLKNNLGVKVELHNQEWKVFLASKRSRDNKYHMVFQHWVGDYLDPLSYLDMFMTDNPNNSSFYSNSEYDRLVQIAQLSPKQQERLEVMHKAESILMKEMGVIPTSFGCIVASVDPKVKGFVDEGNSIFNFAYAYKES